MRRGGGEDRGFMNRDRDNNDGGYVNRGGDGGGNRGNRGGDFNNRVSVLHHFG